MTGFTVFGLIAAMLGVVFCILSAAIGRHGGKSVLTAGVSMILIGISVITFL